MERPPPPGVRALNNPFGSVGTGDEDLAGLPPPGASVDGARVKKAAVPEHLQDPTDRRAALKRFPSAVIAPSDDPSKVGYVIQIPLNPNNAAPSAVRRGLLSKQSYEKNRERYYQDEEPAPAPRAAQSNHLRNLSDDEIEDDPRFEKDGASAESELGQIPPYTSAGEGKTKRLINQPIDPNHPGEAKVGPGDWEASKRKQQYDTVQSTKKPWEQFKNPFKGASWKTPSVEKLAAAVGLNLQPYSVGTIWSRATPPLLLDMVMLGHFGKDWLGWEPEVVCETLMRSGLISESDLASIFEKLMAVQVLHSCDIFWENWGAFEKICLALLGREVDGQQMQPLAVEDMARAILVARGLPGLKLKVLGEEVARYIAAKILDNQRAPAPGVPNPAESRIGVDGLAFLPPPIAEAQPYLDPLQPAAAALVPQVRTAYQNRWPVTGSADALNLQLDKCYRLEAYVRAP